MVINHLRDGMILQGRWAETHFTCWYKKKDSPYFLFPEPWCDYDNGFKHVQPTLYIYHRTFFWKTRLGKDICMQRIELFGIHPGLFVHWTFSKHHQKCGFRMSDSIFFCDVDFLRTCRRFSQCVFWWWKTTQQTDLWKTSWWFPSLEADPSNRGCDTKKVMPLHVFWCWWEVSNERFTT